MSRHRPLYTVLYGAVVQFSMQTTDVIVCMSAHRCKNFFYVFYFDHVFCYVFKGFFYFLNVFLFLKNVGKVQSGKQINKKHFQNNSNENQWVHK